MSSPILLLLRRALTELADLLVGRPLRVVILRHILEARRLGRPHYRAFTTNLTAADTLATAPTPSAMA